VIEYIVEHDPEKPMYLMWKYSIYKQSGNDLVRVSVDYAASQNEADIAAKEYIDEWENM
jgi:hypothetical protein